MLGIVELFAFLDPLRDAGFSVSFTARVPEVVGNYQKEEALEELEPFHKDAVKGLGYAWDQLYRAEQVHGVEIVRVFNQRKELFIPNVDGLMTDSEESLLGIYTADCGLIWVADIKKRSIALLHSGRKGSEGGILSNAIRMMNHEFGSEPCDLLVVLGPCIRPPLYEVDFASLIRKQAENAGVGRFYDSGICTGLDLKQYYSYRMEKGKTGRMLGLLGVRAPH